MPHITVSINFPGTYMMNDKWAIAIWIMLYVLCLNKNITVTVELSQLWDELKVQKGSKSSRALQGTKILFSKSKTCWPSRWT